ncbi:MAG: TauD/TfdA family dioxygenase [Minisyncoccia bacterium]
MIIIEPIEFPGIEAILENAEFYKNKFISDSVICFRNANIAKEESFEFSKKLSSAMGFHVYENNRYIENHARRSNIDSVGADEVLVEWHIEHTYYPNPIVAATWNMYKFNTDTENGKTYFVDTGVIFETFSDEEKEFLVNCNITEEESVKKELMTQSKISDNYPIISNHWISGKPIIRYTMLPGNRYPVLVSYKNESPDDEAKSYFNSLMGKVTNEIALNEDIRIVQKWREGDLVIPDLFKLAHAVTGGFKSADREFIGIWGYKNAGGPV